MFIVRYSYLRSGERQRFSCHRCDRTFNELTGTVLHYIHDYNKFQHYFKCLVEQKSLRECEREVGICLHTSFYWRHKILKSFEKADLKPLKKRIEVDDAFLAVSFKGNPKAVAELERNARKRGGGITTRGIHDEHACILAACDKEKNIILSHVGEGRLTKAMVNSTLHSFIRKQRVNKAIFVTDRHNSYPEFAEKKNLNHQTVVSSYGQRVNVLGFHIQNVNAIHNRLKRWLSKFNGVSTKYLQNYLNYFRLWDKFTYIKERLVYFVKISGKNSNVFQKIIDIYLE